MTYEIKKYGEPVLKKKAEPVTEFGEELKKIFDDMLETMYAFNGVGLAANQVGILKQMLVIDTSRDEDRVLLYLANPVITSVSKDKVTFEEGCLSFPGIFEKIDRPAGITVSAFDPYGKPLKIEAEGFLSIVLQHEIDHLNGVVFIDRMSPARKLMHGKELKEIKEETKKKAKLK